MHLTETVETREKQVFRVAFCALLGMTILLAGCTGIPARSEKQAAAELKHVEQVYRPHDRKLPDLGTNATLTTLLTFAMLNNPQVEAAYYEYAASVQNITTTRSLPDPRLTLELDIQEVVMVVMPGLMADVPWVQRLQIQADEASQESTAKYYAFESAVLRAAYEVKRPYFQLRFLEDRIRINQETLRLLGELEQNARAQTEAGRATLQDILRAQIEQERLRIEIENLEDSRVPLIARLKGALGLRHEEPDPPVPHDFEAAPLDLSSDRLFTMALERNPKLKQMEAEVRMAQTGIRLAHQSKLPDFSLGAEADVRANPAMWRPSIGVTLPIWRDKIAAEIGAAQARKKAAEARLSAEQIQLAVEFADTSFMYREANRNLRLLTDSLLTKAQQSLDVARAGYVSNRTGFIDLLDAERSLLEFQLAEVEARTTREQALAKLSLVIVGLHPPEAPILANAPESPAK